MRICIYYRMHTIGIFSSIYFRSKIVWNVWFSVRLFFFLELIHFFKIIFHFPNALYHHSHIILNNEILLSIFWVNNYNKKNNKSYLSCDLIERLIFGITSWVAATPTYSAGTFHIVRIEVVILINVMIDKIWHYGKGRQTISF